MRRSIAGILIVTVIFLSASCGRTVKEPERTDTTRETTTAEPVSGSKVKDQTAFFQLSALPDIGEHKSNTVTGRWYDTYQDHLIPRDDYGTLVPFIGEIQDFGEPNYMDDPEDEGESYINVEPTISYGLMTTDGRIVVDAAYRSFWVRTAPNGETFYDASVYSEINVPSSTDNKYDSAVSGRKGYLMDSKGSKVLEIPYGCYFEFTKDRVVVAPDLYGSEEDGDDMDSIKIYDIKDFKLVKQLSCRALSGEDPYEDYGGISALSCGLLEYRGVSGNFFCDLNGNRVFQNETDLFNAWSFGEYIVLSYNDANKQKVIDISGKECLPGVYSDISLCSVDNDPSDNNEFLCVKQNDKYRCYDRKLRAMGPVFDEFPQLVRLFGRIYYRTQNPLDSNLTYYDLETGKQLDWSKYTELDMSEFEPDYEEDYKAPTVVGDRYFLHEYVNLNSSSRMHIDVIDLKSGETVLEAKEKNTDVFGDRWLLLIDYYYASDYLGQVFDAQTGSVTEQAKGLQVRELDGVPYCIFMRNGYSVVKNLKTQETLLNMFIASAG